VARDRDHEVFAQIALPHLDAAFNLARWLTRDHHFAEDVVQEAYLRAFKFIGTFRGGDGKAWLLTIVRNTFLSLRKQNHPEHPQALLIRNADGRLVGEAMEALPAQFREVLVLREIEELSYKEIAMVTNMPIGTVMSRLARARALLRGQLEHANEEH
jgi:RNA polymerase sigma-70 factor (ECF subfamily)